MFMAYWGLEILYTDVHKNQVTLKSNISEKATNNRLYQAASIDASFIFTSSAMAGLIRPAVSIILCRTSDYLSLLQSQCI